MNVIIIDTDLCEGCGACVEVCPEAAIYLVDGKAMVDGILCRDCQACIAACPTEAISLASQEQEPALRRVEGSKAEAVRTPALRPEPEVIRVRTQPPTVPLRRKVVPVLGAALAWAGREIMTQLADYALYSLDRHIAERQKPGIARSQSGNGTRRPAEGGMGRRRRRRRRGG